jgi:hypothetical protein
MFTRVNFSGNLQTLGAIAQGADPTQHFIEVAIWQLAVDTTGSFLISF